jgi:hypothetical protein
MMGHKDSEEAQSFWCGVNGVLMDVAEGKVGIDGEVVCSFGGAINGMAECDGTFSYKSLM